MSGVFSCGDSRRVMAIHLPSGDQANGEGAGPGGWATGRLHDPLVSRRAAPPFGETSQMCDGVSAALVRKSSSSTSNDLLLRSTSLLFFSPSSAVTYAICEPSGLQANCCTPLA